MCVCVLADMSLFLLFVAGQRRGGEDMRCSCAGVVVCMLVVCS